jgi:ribosomal protein L7Ae-like RNA K-turn-binding protein
LVNKIYGLLGICSKAGKITAGTDAVIEGVYKNQIELVIVAEDTSQKTKQKIENVCKEKNVTLKSFGTIFDNSKAIGKVNKAIIGINDKNLAKAILEKICGGEEFEGK